MEVTRTLRVDKLAKAGLTQIHLTFCWDNLRLRLGSKQRRAPRDWDAPSGRVKKGYTYAEAINQGSTTTPTPLPRPSTKPPATATQVVAQQFNSTYSGYSARGIPFASGRYLVSPSFPHAATATSSNHVLNYLLRPV